MVFTMKHAILDATIGKTTDARKDDGTGSVAVTCDHEQPSYACMLLHSILVTAC
jgi:hypothetical protein